MSSQVLALCLCLCRGRNVACVVLLKVEEDEDDIFGTLAGAGWPEKSRSTCSERRSIRFRSLPRTYRGPTWGARAEKLTKSRTLPTLTLFV